MGIFALKNPHDIYIVKELWSKSRLCWEMRNGSRKFLGFRRLWRLFCFYCGMKFSFSDKCLRISLVHVDSHNHCFSLPKSPLPWRKCWYFPTVSIKRLEGEIPHTVENYQNYLPESGLLGSEKQWLWEITCYRSEMLKHSSEKLNIIPKKKWNESESRRKSKTIRLTFLISQQKRLFDQSSFTI
jgi:hypothetical protein